LLGLPLADNVKAWFLQGDGSYQRGKAGPSAPIRCQMEFMKRALRTKL